MLTIPLQPVPSQDVIVSLANQPCQLSVYQKQTGLYFDLSVNNEPVVTGVIGENRNRMVRDAYLGFTGDFIFIDTQGDTDPVYTGLGARYLLAYLEVSDLAGAA